MGEDMIERKSLSKCFCGCCRLQGESEVKFEKAKEVKEHEPANKAKPDGRKVKSLSGKKKGPNKMVFQTPTPKNKNTKKNSQTKKKTKNPQP